MGTNLNRKTQAAPPLRAILRRQIDGMHLNRYEGPSTVTAIIPFPTTSSLFAGEHKV